MRENGLRTKNIKLEKIKWSLDKPAGSSAMQWSWSIWFDILGNDYWGPARWAARQCFVFVLVCRKPGHSSCNGGEGGTRVRREMTGCLVNKFVKFRFTWYKIQAPTDQFNKPRSLPSGGLVLSVAIPPPFPYSPIGPAAGSSLKASATFDRLRDRR